MDERRKNGIIGEVREVCDLMESQWNRLDTGYLKHYADSADGMIFNVDGSRWDFPAFRKIVAQYGGSASGFRWTTVSRDFIVVAEDLVICPWVARDETTMKSGDRISYDRHAHTFVFRKIAGEWKVIYQHDSGVPVITKAGGA